MGCDVHMFAEVKKDGSWQKVGKIFKGWNDKPTDEPYHHRNYDLFAILANVRNGEGFAGIDTGDGFMSIAMPRDLPLDVSAEIKKESDDWNGDGHSHSYFTVAELLQYDWTLKTRHRGFVSPDEYKVFKEKGKPEQWCGGVGGSNIINNEEMDKRIKNGIDSKDTGFGARHYTRVEWSEPYKDSCTEFLEETIPSLKGLGTPDNVRIVFWFDN